MPRVVALVVAALSLLAGSGGVPCAAGEWPQILGPQRNGIAVDEKITAAFPAAGPKVLWQRKVGEGFAGVAVADGIAVLFHRVGNEEVVEAMNARSGDVLWKRSHPTTFHTAFSSDNGPRCTPLIHQGRVYVFGAQGVLRSLRLKDGTVLWTRKTHKEFGAPEGYFGAGSTPLVEDGKLLVNVGSRKGAGIVAFDLQTGRTVWKATNEYASYSSPVAATIHGIRHVFFITRLKFVSLNPVNGRVRFSFPFGRRGPTVNAATPLVLGDRVFLSAHYGVGAVYAKIGPDKADVLWRSDDIMSNHYMTCLQHEGHLIGIHGQERLNEPELRCFDPRTKKIRWVKRGFGYGAMIKADGKLIALTTAGTLILLKADVAQYRELSRAQIFTTTTRALPALAGGRLYVRDTRTLKCLDLRP